MHVSFWFESVIRDFLFKGYNITSLGGLIATCFGLASLAAVLEIIKVYRASIYLKKAANNDNKNVCTASQQEDSNSNARGLTNKCDTLKLLALQSTWYTIQDMIGYIVMLAVMTFNGYFTIAVILGSGLGYFVFGPWLMDLKLNAGAVCGKQQKCAVCIAKLERSHLLSSSSGHSCDASSNNDTNNSLAEVAEGLASVMQNSGEERVAVEVHSQEHCT